MIRSGKMSRLDASKIAGLLTDKTSATWGPDERGGLVARIESKPALYVSRTWNGTLQLRPPGVGMRVVGDNLFGRGWHIRAAALLADQPEVRRV